MSNLSKFLLITTLLLLHIISGYKVNAFYNQLDSHISNQEEEVNQNINVTDVSDELFFKYSNIIKLNNNTFVGEMNNSIYVICDNVVTYIGPSILIHSVIVDNNNQGIIYILSYRYSINNAVDTYIYSFTISNKKVKEKLISSFTSYGFVVDEYIYVCGRSNNDASIFILDDNLICVNEVTMGGEGFEEFTSLCIIDNHLYASLYSDGISKDSEFGCLGSDKEMKCMIVVFDVIDKDTLEYKENNIYITNNGQNERISNLINDDGELLFKLCSDDDVFYLSVLDNKVKKTLKLDNKYDKEYLLPNKKKSNNFVSIRVKENEVYLYENNNIISLLLSNANICSVYINLGSLYLINKDKNLSIYRIDEDSVRYSNEYHLNRYNYDYTNTNHFELESYFDTYSFYLKSIDPFFQSTVSGVYTCLYESKRSDERLITFEKNIIVDDYMNFTDQGIYKTGKILEFFGNAYIDDKLVYYGHMLESEGIYNIRIDDINANSKYYTIYIVNDYYKDDNTHYMSNIISEDDEFFTLSYEAIEDVLLNSIIVNGKHYDFENKNKVYEVELPKISNDINVYNVERIDYSIGSTFYSSYDFNNTYYVKYKLDNPIINVYKKIESKNNKTTIDINIVDLDKTFCYLRFDALNKTYMLDKSTTMSNIGSISNNDIKLSINLVYNDNINNNYINLLDVDLIDKYTKCNVDITYNEGMVTNIKIVFNTIDNALNINNSVIKYSSQDKNIPLLLIIIISSLVFIILSITYIITIRMKRRKDYNLLD